MELGVNAYPAAIHPHDHEHLTGFRLDPFPVWTWQVGAVRVEKRVFLVRGQSSVVVRYQASGPCALTLRPLIALRDDRYALTAGKTVSFCAEIGLELTGPLDSARGERWMPGISINPLGGLSAQLDALELRPNQIFTVSLPFSPLTAEQAGLVFLCVEKWLLTPFGLRTLASAEPGYRPRYEGDQHSRDGAYHQGTVWPWLMGPYVDALLRVKGRSPAALKACAKLLGPLEARMMDEGCLGQVSEVFDGDAPHRAGGCPAQAWSVAELLRLRLSVL